MRVQEWEKDKQEFVWARNWRICKDNACPSEIRLADVYGNLFLQKNTLIYVGIEQDKQQQMKELLQQVEHDVDRKSTRLNSSHVAISYAVFCLKKKKKIEKRK